MYIQVLDVRGYLGKEGDRIVFGAMSVFKCEGSPPPILTDCGGSFQRDFYLHSTAGFPAPGFPGGSVMKNPPAKARDSGDMGSIPGLEKSSGVGNGNPSSILARKSHEQRSWQATECVVAKSQTRLTD